MTFLPYGRQTIDDDDVAAVAAVLRSDYLTTGPVVEEFERDLTAIIGARHVVSCANGTAGLHLAALALGLGPGDTVIVPAVTFLATANAAIYVGADVVFADVDPESGLMRPSDLAAVLQSDAVKGKRVAAVFNVHLTGQCEDQAAIAGLAADAGAAVVEDACHAIGSRWRGAPIGNCSHSRMAVFSFHPVKTIATGEGGAVSTNDEQLNRRLQLFRSHGMVREPAEFVDPHLGLENGQPVPGYYEMAEPGFNYRLTDVQAALGVSQLRKLDSFVARRKALADAYDARLAPMAALVRPIRRNPECEPAWHIYVVRIDFERAGRTRAEVMNALRALGIGTQIHYRPLPQQPFYRRRETGRTYPGAEGYYQACLSLPLYPSMSIADVDRVVAALGEVLRP